MAMYTYRGNYSRDNHTSRVVFSTGKDMVVGEQVDLTAGEIIEASKSMGLDIVSGSVAVPITNLNFPAVQKFVRVGSGVVVKSG